MEEFKLSELLNGRPENINNENEKKCYDILEELILNIKELNIIIFQRILKN